MKILKFIETLLGTTNITNFWLRVFGSFLIILSALSLFADKFIWWEFEDTFGFPNTSSFVWVVCQTLCPLIFVIAVVLFKPFLTSYLSLVYVTSIQLYWLFTNTSCFDDYLSHTYALGSIVVVLFVSYIVSKAKFLESKAFRENKEENRLTREAVKLIKLQMNKSA